MDSLKKRNLFLAVTLLLVVVIVAVSAVILARGPRDSAVELIQNNGDGTLDVNDLNDGRMTIPYYNIAGNSYELDSFKTGANGTIVYEGGDSSVGINVNYKDGDIDWAQVKESGVDFAMIRVGWRGQKNGNIVLDSKFEENIAGATEAGLQVGVYFYSKAINAQEAEEEATFVLEQIRLYSVTYPVGIYWEYSTNEDGSMNQSARTIQCNGDQVTDVIEAFCNKVKQSGRTPCYYASKTMAYDTLDLGRLSGFDLWYAEYRSQPSFYYDFKMWQYTEEGNVPGISQKVPLTLCLKKYGN